MTFKDNYSEILIDPNELTILIVYKSYKLISIGYVSRNGIALPVRYARA